MKLNIPKRFYNDRDWAYKHYNDFIKRYGDRWIAIYNKKVLASSSDPYRAADQARKIAKVKMIPVVFVERMPHVY